MKSKAAFVLFGIVVAAVLFGSGYFLHKCPKAVKPIREAQIPEIGPAKTKEPLPPKPVIRWEKETVLDVATLTAAEKAAFEKGYKKGWETCAAEHHAFMKPERFKVTHTVPHTDDSVTFWPLADTFSVIHMGIMPTVLAGGEERKRRSSFLHLGVTGWFGEPAQVWGTIPLPRERRAFYLPHRGGLDYKPKAKPDEQKWRLVFEWNHL